MSDTPDTDPATLVSSLCDDLADEHTALDAKVADLDEDAWSTPTPAEGWSVRDQISHLTFFDVTARLAIEDPERFREHVKEFASAAQRDRELVGDTDLGRRVSGAELLDRWRRERAGLIAAARSAPPGERVPWYAQPMSLASFITARMMETWSHGQDVVDALNREPVVSERLRHVCDIGVRARRYAYLVNGLDDAGDPVRVELTSPAGALWTWGPDDAADRVSGPALDFALVATQRRHRADTRLKVIGSTADQWLAIAQTFAGPPGTRRRPGLRALAQ
ncbi:TIGR03084 family metal-binding protein [[Mycobacterium] nativiensis]|uniref:TIGR03084 family metal-binding protein n=1 Tax=[Mycobacterium] nativiensis TaxID=2855503 RepID=A0ABU5XV55_9MYCO|nr:TIGR03084 family metal-binding protein [Mycolicibacter sp. MYC340]MEB3031864.1 TIGR03084 family metal-binding protein [Mycolicibacter sp. MYC340]